MLFRSFRKKNFLHCHLVACECRKDGGPRGMPCIEVSRGPINEIPSGKPTWWAVRGFGSHWEPIILEILQDVQHVRVLQPRRPCLDHNLPHCHRQREVFLSQRHCHGVRLHFLIPKATPSAPRFLSPLVFGEKVSSSVALLNLALGFSRETKSDSPWCLDRCQALTGSEILFFRH